MSSSDESYQVEDNPDASDSPNSDSEVISVTKPKKHNQTQTQHKCSVLGCGAVFSRPYRLKNHIATHHEGQKPYSCDFEDCNKSYSSQSHLIRHKKVAHTDESAVNTETEVMCSVEGCSMVCANNYTLKKHINNVHTDLPFECSICNKKFRRKSHLHEHKIEVHNEAAPYQCDKCSLSFVHFYLFQKHKNRHVTYKCDCGSIFEKWSPYLKHKKSECSVGKSSHVCAICQKTFSTKFNLTQHSLKVHLQESQEETFQCPYVDCTRSYKYKKNLSWHMKTFHNKVFEYCKCPEEDCGIVLKSQRSLKRHLQDVHSTKGVKSKTKRKPRKDKGIKKINVATELSGIGPSQINDKELKEVSSHEELPNIEEVQPELPQNCDEVNLMIIKLPETHKESEMLDTAIHLEDVLIC